MGREAEAVCGVVPGCKGRRYKVLGLLGMFAMTITVCFLINPTLYLPRHSSLLRSEKLIRISLPAIESEPEDIENSDIVFLETSGRTALKARDGCALESAAHHHPQRTVMLYSTSPIATEDGYRTALKDFTNVKFAALDVDTLFQGTPLQEWHASGQIKDSSHPIQHLSDAARLAILWKSGGTYLDTDMITIRPLGNLSNALGYGTRNAGNSALVFHRGHPFLYKCMEDYANNYTPTAYDFHGPQLVTRVLKKVCFEEDLEKVVRKPELCQGITLLPDHTFFAFPWTQWKQLFESAQKADLSRSYTVHLYAKMSADTTGRPGDGSLLDILTSTNCPNIYRLMTQQNAL